METDMVWRQYIRNEISTHHYLNARKKTGTFAGEMKHFDTKLCAKLISDFMKVATLTRVNFHQDQSQKIYFLQDAVVNHVRYYELEVRSNAGVKAYAEIGTS